MASGQVVTRIISLTNTRSFSSRMVSKMSPAANSLKKATRRLHATTQHLQPAIASVVTTSTIDSFPKTHNKINSPVDTHNFLNNQFIPSQATKWIDIHDPATNNLVTRVPQSTDTELKAAVASAQKAFPEWRNTSLLHRQQIMFKFVGLIR